MTRLDRPTSPGSGRPTDLDQRALVERARRGDHDAFAALVRGRIGRLDTAARLILRDPELARDAVQDGLTKAWRDLRQLRDPGNFDAWLYRLTVNSCLEALRRRRRRPIEVEITALETPTVADLATSVADRELVDGVLRRLDAPERAIVVLHYYLGLPLTEVAGSLGIPVGTVKSRLHRALGDMRSGLEAGAPAPAAGVGGALR
jgi:RNA polymerase sigma-70 factor (ECF subfamily)